jgi:uncharacterized membrane protein YccC
MLIIYVVCIEIVREVRPYAERIARFDRDLARQLKKSSSSAALNVAEASGTRGGRRRNTHGAPVKAGRRKQVSETREHQHDEQVLPREESTPGKPSLALPGATLGAKRR